MGNFFFLILFLFGLAALLQLDWIYYLLYVVGGVWLISHWWVRRSLQRLYVSREMADRAFSGEEIQGSLILRNPNRLPVPWVRVQESVPNELNDGNPYRAILSLQGQDEVRHDFRLYCHRRGYYRVGPLRLHTGDLFGFAEANWLHPTVAPVIVYPQVLTLPQLGLPSQLPFGSVASRRRLFEDPARIGGVRAYASGDSMRHIHWPASAHADSLLVKKYQPAIALDTTVVLDLFSEAYPIRQRFSHTEWAIVVAASLASHLAQQRQSVGILVNGWDPVSQAQAQAIPSQTGQGHLMTILDLLARIQTITPGGERADVEGDRPSSAPAGEAGAAPAESRWIEAWLPGRVSSLSWGTTLMVVTPRINDALIWALHGLYRRGLRVLVIDCVGGGEFRHHQARAKQLGVQLHQAVWESDLAKMAASPRRGAG